MSTAHISPRHAFARKVLARPSLFALVAEKDDLQRLQAAHQRADEALKAPRPPVKDIDIVTEVCAALMAGEPLPKDFGARKAKAEAEVAVRAAETNALRKIQADLGLDIALLVEDAVPDMIEALDAEQAELIERAAELLEQLGGNVDPLAAIKAKRTAELEAFLEAHATFLRIREDAEIILVQEAGRPAIDTDNALHRYMRAAGRVWPDWLAVKNEPTQAGIMKLHGDAPWPEKTDSAEFFNWLVENRHDAEP